MKNLIVYSTLTGNTKKVAEAIAEALPECEIHPVENAPAPGALSGYTMVGVGYWVDKGQPDAKAKAYMEALQGQRVALFGTLGAWPDSEHARDCEAKSAALAGGEDGRNTVVGSFICQGKVDPRLLEAMKKMKDNPHPDSPERAARLAEAAKHPDAEDCRKAAQAFIGFLNHAVEATA